MSLLHDFMLVATDVNESTIDTEFCMRIMKNIADPKYTILNCIGIEDAVFDFLWFSFQWIPSINPDFYSDNRYSCGLFRHGITLFNERSKLALETNCKCWLQLIQFAPDTIPLYNSYLNFLEKESFIIFINQLLQFSGKLDQNNFFIFHFGI